MTLLKNLFNTDKDNCVWITSLLLDELRIGVSHSHIEQDLTSHPDYPSMLSIVDALSNNGIKTTAVNISFNTEQTPNAPFITIIKGSGEEKLYTLIRPYNDSGIIEYFHPDKNKWTSIHKNKFAALWASPTCLFVSSSNKLPKKKTAHIFLERNVKKFTRLLSYTVLPVLTFTALLFPLIIHKDSKYTWSLSAYGTLSLIGLLASLLLISHEFGKQNNLSSRICRSAKQFNCNAILESSASHIFGISWSSIGGVYFAGNLLFFFITLNANFSRLWVFALLSTITVPYAIFSLFYQWRIARQWCLYCVIVQLTLIGQSTIVFIEGWHKAIMPSLLAQPLTAYAILLAYALPFTAINYILPYVRRQARDRVDRTQLNGLKYNWHVFNSLLSKEKPIASNPEGLGLKIGPQVAKHRILKVCNPYCEPCSRSHIQLESLLAENPDISLQIIYTATSSPEDSRLYPVRHFLSLAENYDYLQFVAALSEWYSSDVKSYAAFATKYPVDTSSNDDNKIDAMSKWCNEMNIEFTPSYFIDGYQLPEIYKVEDLKYLLSS